MYGKRKLADMWTMLGTWGIVAVAAMFSLAPVFV